MNNKNNVYRTGNAIYNRLKSVVGKRWCLGVVFSILVVFACIYAARPEFIHRKINSVHSLLKQADVKMNLRDKVCKSSVLLQTSDCSKGLNQPELWIAHGGGVGEFFYTNCEEAVKDSLSRGFRYIELDISITTDGHLVGAHTWSELRALLGADNTGNQAMSRSEIEALKSKWKRTPLFEEDICRLMQENPDMVLVTDKIQDFDLLMEKIPFPERMIVEAFDTHHYLSACRAGFSHVALTVWSIHGLMQAMEYQLPAIVLAAQVVDSQSEALPLIEELHRSGCCIMVHWASICDKPEFVHKYLGRSISRIYTDTWSPQQPPSLPEGL